MPSLLPVGLDPLRDSGNPVQKAETLLSGPVSNVSASFPCNSAAGLRIEPRYLSLQAILTCFGRKKNESRPPRPALAFCKNEVEGNYVPPYWAATFNDEL